MSEYIVEVMGDNDAVTVSVDEYLRGNDGKSAYEIAVGHGFVGTEQEWLESLRVSGEIGDYEKLFNKPKINGVELVGDKTNGEIGIEELSNLEIEELLNSQF